MVNMGSNVHHSYRGKYWWMRRITPERDVIRQRLAWIERIIWFAFGGATFYGLIQMWGG